LLDDLGCLGGAEHELVDVGQALAFCWSRKASIKSRIPWLGMPASPSTSVKV
jgi:hypothetical protein